MTQVVNIYRDQYDVYIGRAGKGHDGYFGNPFPLFPGQDRGAVIEQYKAYFLDRISKDAEFKRRVLELKGKRLGCFCAPLACHGDVIKEFIQQNSATS